MERIVCDLGAPPWEPNGRAHLVEVLNYYDRPLDGVLVERESWRRRRYWLFSCLGGYVSEPSLWEYAPVTRREVRRLLRRMRRASVDRRIELFASHFDDRPTVVFQANEAGGITKSWAARAEKESRRSRDVPDQGDDGPHRDAEHS